MTLLSSVSDRILREFADSPASTRLLKFWFQTSHYKNAYLKFKMATTKAQNASDKKVGLIETDVRAPCVDVHLFLFAFQPEEQLPLHMACSRPSGAVEIVKTLLKASGKDAKLTSDKVSKKCFGNLN